MRATILNGTLKPSPGTSNTEGLASYVAGALRERGVDEVTHIRLVDHDVKLGVESDMGDGDAWPAIREQILASEILIAIVATPTWLGQLELSRSARSSAWTPSSPRRTTTACPSPTTGSRGSS